VDDDYSVRDGLATLLDISGFNVCTFSCGDDFLAHPLSDSGCILLDVRMPGMDGLQVQKKLSSRGNKLPVIFLTAYSDVPRIVDAMKEGAEDFLIKPVDGDALIERIKTVLEKYSQHAKTTIEEREFYVRIGALSPREHEILVLSIEGLSCKDIGNVLKTSYRTIEIQRSKICEKFNVAKMRDIVCLVAKLHITLPASRP
jgi:FixJ family two-component response regulator